MRSLKILVALRVCYFKHGKINLSFHEAAF
jgi:hypothetical protein